MHCIALHSKYIKPLPQKPFTMFSDSVLLNDLQEGTTSTTLVPKSSLYRLFNEMLFVVDDEVFDCWLSDKHLLLKMKFFIELGVSFILIDKNGFDNNKAYHPYFAGSIQDKKNIDEAVYEYLKCNRKDQVVLWTIDKDILHYLDMVVYKASDSFLDVYFPELLKRRAKLFIV